MLGAFLQVPPAARHPLRRQSRRQRADAGRSARPTCAPTRRRCKTSMALTAREHLSARWNATPVACMDWFARFLPVGFYYKAFHGKRLFPLWERMIRAMTGLGRVDFATPRLRTPKRYGFCDVLVVGAGPSGLSRRAGGGRAGGGCGAGRREARPWRQHATAPSDPHRSGSRRIRASASLTEHVRRRLLRRPLGAVGRTRPHHARCAPARRRRHRRLSNSRPCSATTTCRGSCSPRRRSA